MAKMMSNGGGSGLATISFANHQNHRSSHSGGHSNNSHMLNSGGNSPNSSNDPMFVSNRRARSNNFTLKETFDLLKIWASPEMQWQMKHNFRNFRVWEAISYHMGQMGHDRTAIQCKNRIQNLTSIFYRIKKSKQDPRSFNFPYYKTIGDVLDGKKAGVSLGSSFSSVAGSFGIPHPNDPFLNAARNNNDSIDQDDSQNNSAAGFAAHLALVEEYQSLLNGQPDPYEESNDMNGDQDQPSSINSNSGHNVLSPEVSLSEGDSPIRVEGNKNANANSNQKLASARNGPSSGQRRFGDGDTLPTSLLKIEHDDSINVTLEDNNGDIDDDELNIDESMGVGEDDEFHDDIGESNAMPRNKRSFSATFGSSYGAANKGGFPTKRPRGVSAASSSGGGQSSHRLPHINGGSDDPIVQYLADMVDIERQWLDMERQRAENERSMMMYMMQILQALVCPQQDEEEQETEVEGDEGVDAEGEAADGNGDDVNEAYEEDQASTRDDETAQLRKMLNTEEDEGEEEEEELHQRLPQLNNKNEITITKSHGGQAVSKISPNTTVTITKTNATA